MFHLPLNEINMFQTDGVFKRNGVYFKIEKGKITDIFFEEKTIVTF